MKFPWFSRKYEILKYGKHHGRICALRDIPLHGVKKGDLGGFVKSYSNLAQDGECWVGGNAIVADDSQVYDNALVTGESNVFAYAKVYGNALITGNAFVGEHSNVSGNAVVGARGVVSGTSEISGNAKIHAWVDGDSEINGYTMVVRGHHYGICARGCEIIT